jgi:hypothetical protein
MITDSILKILLLVLPKKNGLPGMSSPYIKCADNFYCFINAFHHHDYRRRLLLPHHQKRCWAPYVQTGG